MIVNVQFFCKEDKEQIERLVVPRISFDLDNHDEMQCAKSSNFARALVRLGHFVEIVRCDNRHAAAAECLEFKPCVHIPGDLLQNSRPRTDCCIWTRGIDAE